MRYSLNQMIGSFKQLKGISQLMIRKKEIEENSKKSKSGARGNWIFSNSIMEIKNYEHFIKS